MDKLYIPGDLVYIHGSLRIISNCDGYYATYYDENESFQEVNVNVIEGIPIIPEILEKNGWIGTKRALFVTYTKIVYTRVIFTIIETIGEPHVFRVCCGRNNCLLRNVMYVHELQHLLFGLGINHEMEV